MRKDRQLKIGAVRWFAIVITAMALSACESVGDYEDPLAENIIDEAYLNDRMLTASNPAEAA